jgi:hypothetical protein
MTAMDEVMVKAEGKCLGACVPNAEIPALFGFDMDWSSSFVSR